MIFGSKTFTPPFLYLHNKMITNKTKNQKKHKIDPYFERAGCSILWLNFLRRRIGSEI